MKNRILIFCAAFVFIISMPVFAQEAGEGGSKSEKDATEATKKAEEEGGPAIAIEFDNTFVSNYVFRGSDLFTNRAVQEGKSYGAHSGAWAYQPTISFGTSSGWSFSIWGSYAMEGRNDVDVDERIQTSPGGASLLSDFHSSMGNLTAYDGTADAMLIAGTAPNLTAAASTFVDTSVAKQHKEQNGLKRLDEIDFTIDYTLETKKSGSISFGIIAYYLPGTFQSHSGNLTEAYISYTTPVVPLTLSAYGELTSADMYFSAGTEHEIELSDSMAISLGVSTGYGVYAGLQGWQDITGSVGLSVGGFSVGFNAAYRPNLAIHEKVLGNTPGDKNIPLWLNGGSTVFDGMVADPGQTTGLANDLIVQAINANNALKGHSYGNYSYTPRKKLPRVVYWLNIGYTLEIL